MWKCKVCGEEDCFNQIIECGTRWGTTLDKDGNYIDKQQHFACCDEDIEYYWECYECCESSISDDLKEIAEWVEEE